MRRFLMVLSIIALGAVTANAGGIVECQTGFYPVDSHVDITNAVVTGTHTYGVFINETWNAPYTGIWLYLGTDWQDTWSLVPGDLVNVGGLYIEYYDYSEIDLVDDVDGYCLEIGTAPIPAPLPLTLADFNADPEPYECCMIQIVDGLTVTDLPGYNQWTAESFEDPGQFLLFHDYWYDFSTVSLGDCYNMAQGILVYGYGAYKLEPFAGEDGIELTDCTIPVQEITFEGLRAMYR